MCVETCLFCVISPHAHKHLSVTFCFHERCCEMREFVLLRELARQQQLGELGHVTSV